MPRQQMTAQHVNRLLQEMSCASILKYIPLKIVSKQLASENLCSQRQRRLPAETIIYLLVTMALHADVSIMENLRILLEPIRRLFNIKDLTPPVGSAIVKARRRLGSNVFKKIFESVCKPSSSKNDKGCFWKNYRLVAVDGTSHNVQDTDENREYFGIHSNGAGENFYPQMKATALMECGSKIFFGLETGAYNSSEQAQYEKLICRLSKDMLLLADRAYFSFKLWSLSSQAAGALIWRVKKGMKLTPVKQLEDGSFLAEIKPSWHAAENFPELKGKKCTVRVVQFKPLFSDTSEGELIRLITTIHDPQEASAEEIAQIYPQRWLIEEGFSEMKRYIGRQNKILRSQTPIFVLQEFYGFLLAHFVIRSLMLESAKENNLAANDLSFVNSLRVIERKIAFFPSQGQ